MINEYIDYLKYEKRLCDNTYQSYHNDLLVFSKSVNKELLVVTKEDIQDFLYSSTVSSRTKAHYLSVINSFYDYLVNNNKIISNPAIGIKMPKIKKTLPDFLSIKEVDTLLNINFKTNLDYRNKAMFEVMYASGLRVSELINLELNNINYQEQIIKVYGKGKKERYVPVNDIALKYLRIWIDEYRSNVIRKKSNNYVFINTFGNKLTRQGFFKILKSRAVESGIKKDISPHTLRHSFATHLLNNGADIIIIQELLGHENLVTTEIYAHTQNTKIATEYKNHPHAKKF